MRMRIRWLACLLICGMLACSGCGSKEKKAVQPKKKEPAKKTESATDPVEASGEAAVPEEGLDTEVLPNSADTEEEAAIRGDIAMRLPFSAGDDKICAIVYLGKGREQQEQQLERFFHAYMPEYTKEQMDQLPKVDNGGEEAYLIVPRYKECGLSINFLQKKENGKVEVVFDAQKPEGAFVLYCNPTQDFSNTEVNIGYRANVHVIVPHISSVDGRLEPMQVALDLTDDSVYP